MFSLQTPQPFIVEIIRPPAEEQTIAGLIINSLGLAGAFALAAALLGLIVGYVLIKWNSRRPPEADHMPHISPSLQLDEPTHFTGPVDPPSTRVQ